MDWIAAELANAILIKVVGKLGGDQQGIQDARCPNRAIRWAKDGIAIEAGLRHAELLAATRGPSSTPLSTPGVNGDQAKRKGRIHEPAGGPASVGVPDRHRGGGSPEEAGAPLSLERAGLFRAGTARANCPARDRPDMAFAAKDVCRHMATP